MNEDTQVEPDSHRQPPDPAARGPFRCDFCTATTVTWAYPARPVVLLEFGWGSPDDWAACAACADLIDRGAHEALARRCAAQLLRRGELRPVKLPGAVAAARLLHGAFFAARCGAPRRVG